MSQEKTERYKLHGNQEYCEHETISHIQWPHGWSARHFGDYFGPPGLQNLHMQTQRLPDNAHEERVTHARSISIVLAHSITKNRFTNDQNELAKPKIGSIYVQCAKELPDGDVKWRILPVRFSGADFFFFFCLFVGGGQPTPMQYEALLHPFMSQ
jgi:hypothetical protein